MTSKTTARWSSRSLVVALVAAQAAVSVAGAGTAQAAPATQRISVSSAGIQGDGSSGGAVVNSDGSYIAFSSIARNFAGGVTHGQVYLRDKLRGTTDLVSKRVGGPLPNGPSLDPSISDDGRYIAFQSFASNLVPGDTNGTDDVFVKDRVTGTVTRVSVSSSGAQGSSISSAPAISGDGRYVAFASSASNLVSRDTNSATDVFVHDRVTRTTTRASVGTTGIQANLNSFNPSLSRDGARVAFESSASNLIGGQDTNRTIDVYVGTRTGVLLRASQSSAGAQGDSLSRSAAISGDGRAVAYESRARTLVDGDTNGRSDVFHHRLDDRRTTRVVNGTGSASSNDPGNGDSAGAAINHDGRIVAFHSAASNLVTRDTNGLTDVFIARLDGPRGSQNTLVSVSASGAAGNGSSVAPALSSNNQVVTYESKASNLVTADANGVTDVFARTLQ